MLGKQLVEAKLITEEELDAVWEGLSTWSCLQDLRGSQRLWADFFQAVGRRDATVANTLAVELLGQPQGLSGARTRYLVATGMVARIALREPARALELWNRYGGEMFGGDQPSFFFRHLEQLARREAGG